MASRNRTKKILADTLEEMLQTQTLEEVRVARLCELADIPPRVFYYHFHDKYELATWIYTMDSDAVYGAQSDRDKLSVSLGISNMRRFMQRLWERRELYVKLFADDSMYSLRKYILTYNEAFFAANLKMLYGLKALDAEALHVIKFASYGWFECLVDWLRGSIPLDSDAFGLFEFELISQTLNHFRKRDYLPKGVSQVRD